MLQIIETPDVRHPDTRGSTVIENLNCVRETNVRYSETKNYDKLTFESGTVPEIESQKEIKKQTVQHESRLERIFHHIAS